MDKTITVLGSFVVDLMARSPHIPIQGETVKGTAFKMGPGGKGSNQAVAAHRCGGNVTLITKIGNDVFGNLALEFYQNEGISTDFVFSNPDVGTGIAIIMVDDKSSQNSITVVPGACETITQKEMQWAQTVLQSSTILLCQLEINLDVISPAVALVHQSGGLAILNPAPAPTFPLEDAFIGQFDLITPNETEASLLTGIQVIDFDSAYEAAKKLQGKGVKQVIITMGNVGCFLLTAEGESIMIPAMDVDVVDTTGAGDAFNGGLATALSEGKDLKQAIQFATATAALSVTKMGTAPAMPNRADVLRALQTIKKL